jgi:hypothetical protein
MYRKHIRNTVLTYRYQSVVLGYCFGFAEKVKALHPCFQFLIPDLPASTKKLALSIVCVRNKALLFTLPLMDQRLRQQDVEHAAFML